MINSTELESKINTEEDAFNSLVDFRERFIPAAGDTAPAKFHYEWSDILLNGSGHFAIEAFRESA
ncbi:MAG: hypothetical protein IJP56_05685, partial [Synergistaceae bacterium]|nr:hypothetical protein [Synergistaceae bacterium]